MKRTQKNIESISLTLKELYSVANCFSVLYLLFIKIFIDLFNIILGYLSSTVIFENCVAFSLVILVLNISSLSILNVYRGFGIISKKPDLHRQKVIACGNHFLKYFNTAITS